MGDGELVWEAGTAERPSLYYDETLRFVLSLGLILNGSVFCATDGALPRLVLRHFSCSQYTSLSG